MKRKRKRKRSISNISEKQLTKMEDELEKMGWVRQACGYWNDPITGRHEPSTIAYGIAVWRAS